MKKTNLEGKTRTISMKLLAVLLSAGLLVGGVIGGTVAWLTTKTDDVINTFTTSDIDITLKESTGTEYKMIPGWTITKDPKATVVKGSEDCYLFVKAEKSNDFNTFMTYKIADGWTALSGVDGVYYRIFDSKDSSSSTMGTEYSILKDDQVKVNDEVTKDQMKALKDAEKPTLTFTAYAVQLYKNNNETFSAAEAWDKINPDTDNSATTE